jgi:hypothetical protein
MNILMTKINSLFAFVDLKDPFMAGEIAGEELPGPILSIMSAKQFRKLFLFHTLHTRENAYASVKAVSSRYPDCQISGRELRVSDPKDYSSIIDRLAEVVPKDMPTSQVADCYVCVSSGTEEMRAAWFVLASLGIVKAKLLQVGEPSQSLFGKINVKELRVGTSKGETIRELALPTECFAGEGAKDKVAGDAAKMHPIEEGEVILSRWSDDWNKTISKHAEDLRRQRTAAVCKFVGGVPVPGLDDALQTGDLCGVCGSSARCGKSRDRSRKRSARHRFGRDWNGKRTVCSLDT